MMRHFCARHAMPRITTPAGRSYCRQCILERSKRRRVGPAGEPFDVAGACDRLRAFLTHVDVELIVDPLASLTHRSANYGKARPNNGHRLGTHVAR